MHGAAHTAKAPPSRNDEPRRRAPWTSPAPTSRSGHGSRPMNTSPKTIRTKPAICSSRNWFRGIERPTAAAPAPSRTKTAMRPATNGRLARTTRRAAPGSPSRSASTRRDRRQIARHERQHARSEERDEAGGERDGDGRAGAHGRSARARRRAGARARDRAAASARARPRAAAPAPGEQPDHDRAECEPDERQEPREQVEAALRAAPRARPGRTASTSSALISLFVAPAAIRSRMFCFIRRAIGAFELSSVVSQIGQTSSASSSAGVGRSSLAAAGAASASASRPSGDEPPHARRRERPLDAVVELRRVSHLAGDAVRRLARARRRSTSRGSRSRRSGRRVEPLPS